MHEKKPPQTGDRPVVLVVDDEEPVLKLLARQLEGVPAKIVPTASPAEAIHLLQSMDIAVLLCDLNMPEISGNAVLHTARDVNPNIVSLVVTGGAEISATIKAINEGGIWKYIAKPWRQEELVSLITSALSRYETFRGRQKQLKDLALDVKAETRRVASQSGVKKKVVLSSAASSKSEPAPADAGEPSPEPAGKKQIRIVKKAGDTQTGTAARPLRVVKIAGGKPADKRPRAERYAAGFQHDRYTLKEAIGESPLGVVFRAEDTLLPGQVAIRILASNCAEKADAWSLFLERSRAVMKLSHKHILRLHGVEQGGKRPFMVMELVEGQSMEKVLKLYGKLPLQSALQIGQVSALAVSCAHRLPFVHGDIKPSNLLLTDDGVLKVADFGDYQLTDQFKDAHKPSSLLYMSPERHRGESLDGRSDIYSLAMVLYELITGELPFPDTIDDLSILQHGPTRLQPLPGALDAVFRRALDPDRSQRWASIDDFARAFLDDAAPSGIPDS